MKTLLGKKDAQMSCYIINNYINNDQNSFYFPDMGTFE